MNIPVTLTKTIGLGSAIILASDIAANTSRRSKMHFKNGEAEELTELYQSSIKDGSNSPFAQNLKGQYFNYMLNNNISSFINLVKSKVKAFGNEMFTNAIPLTLAIGALCTKTNFNKKILRGCMPRPLGIACGALLTLLGAKTLYMDVMGKE